MRHVRLGRTGLPVSRHYVDLYQLQEKPISADLNARLDELTLEYRWGDDPR